MTGPLERAPLDREAMMRQIEDIFLLNSRIERGVKGGGRKWFVCSRKVVGMGWGSGVIERPDQYRRISDKVKLGRDFRPNRIERGR